MIAATEIKRQIHGYQGGHELLRGNVKLNREDQDLVDRLSDIAGPLRPGETFEPYLTTYPLPSEQFYVLARTKQDLDAPRAGCVLTASLFIPMEVWELNRSILGLVSVIPVPVRLEPNKIIKPPSKAKFDLIREKRLPEIVEALFLESRRPIVVFDSPDAESIALRVLNSLWPSRRRTSTCTRCLSPRKLKGRELDLVFAPSDARNRFSDWDGRRIGAADRPSGARHRWTKDLVETIFGDGQPNLASWDELGILAGDKIGDEGALRLSLMWRELESKAKSTPNAVLGMLDILNSHSVRPTTAREHLEPLVANAVDLARRDQPSEATWRFYLNLLGKFANRLPSHKTIRELHRASERLASDDPASAVSALRDLENQGRDVPAVLAAGIGDGLSLHLFRDDPSSLLLHIGKRDLLCLIAYSKRFSSSLAHRISMLPTEWTGVTVDALRAPDHDLVKRARRNLLPVLNSSAHAPLLDLLLNDVTPTELFGIVRTVAKATNFDIVEFDRPIVAAARTAEAERKLREAILEAQPSEGADRLLGNALRLDPVDVVWLTTNVPPFRGRSVLVSVLDRADDGAIQALMRDSSANAATLDWLLDDPRDNAYRILRLLRSGLIAPRPFVEIGLKIHTFLGSVERSHLEVDILKCALGELPTDDPINIGRILEELSEQIDASDVVLLLTQPQANQDRIKANIAALLASHENVRRKVASRVDLMTARLISRGTHAFDEDTFVRWAHLISDSRSISGQSHLNASIEVLAYALKHTRSPLSALIVVSFPTVYRQLLDFKGERDFDFLPALLMLPLAFFADWDRAKTARKELVDSFLNSNWPSANLMLAALDADIDQRILRRLSRTRGGALYIEGIWKDASRLPYHQMEAVRSAVNRFNENPRLGDWD